MSLTTCDNVLITVLRCTSVLQELIEDLQEECGKHGHVVDTRIPQPSSGIPVGQGCYGKVYVLMDSAEGALAIQKTFNGRMYDGRSLNVSYIQPAHFYMLPIPHASM